MGKIFIHKAGGGSLTKSIIIVTAPTGSTVTCTKGTTVKTASGKACANLFPYTKLASVTKNGVTFEVQEGGIRVYGRPTTTYVDTRFAVQLPPGNYTLSGLFTDQKGYTMCQVARWSSTGLIKPYQVVSDGSTTFDIDGSEAYEDIAISTTTATNVDIDVFIRPMLVAGTEPAAFSEYYEGDRFVFKNLDIGEWTLKATLSGQTATQTVNITQFDVYRVAMAYRLTPEFTYTGNYKVVQDNDSEISDFANWKGNWKIRFLTSGKVTVTNMHAWNGKIDVFLVGGGASGGRGGFPGNQGGGGSGYTKTYKGITIVQGQSYPIVIGAGGSSATTDGAGNVGGTTSAFGQSANGGSPGGGNSSGGPGGNGGSGGSVGANTGGSDGSNGTGGTPGKGQGTTTREFGESKGKLYAAGGAGTSDSYVPGAPGGGGTGGPNYEGGDGEENTGSGGGASSSGKNSGAGGSGIIIIRNAR